MLHLLLSLGLFVLTILFYLLLRRPIHVLFPLSRADLELQSLRRLRWQAQFPILRPFWYLLPPVSMQPITWKELIIRNILAFLCVISVFILTWILVSH